MPIRSKIGIILAVAVIGFVLAQFCVQKYIILPGFLSLEKENALKNLNRVEASINNEADQLDSLYGRRCTHLHIFPCC